MRPSIETMTHHQHPHAEPPEEPPATRKMGTVMAGIAWLIIMVMLTGFFSGWLDRQVNPNQHVTTAINGQGQREVVLKRNRSGHYVADGTINGVAVTFLLDTGATGVAISPAVARAAGATRGRPIALRTANGTAQGFLTELNRVTLGDIEQYGVPATISPGLATKEVLLGMSFLKHLELVQKGDTLTLKQ